MDNIKKHRNIILIILIILGFVFYWYEWRPIKIRKECAEKHIGNLNDIFYLNCIRRGGLKQ